MLQKLKNNITYGISALSTLIDHVIRAFWPSFCLVAVLLSLAFLGISKYISPWWLSAISIIVIVYSARKGLKRYHPPTARDVENKITQFNGFKINPYRPIKDRPTHDLEYDQKVLWQRNRLYAASLRNRAWPAMPHPNLSHYDRYGLRFVSIAVVIMAWFAVPASEHTQALKTAFIPERPAFLTPTPYVAELWVTPPDYTRLAPIYLKNTAKTLVNVPEGSTLTARTNKGWFSPRLKTPSNTYKMAGDHNEGYTLAEIPLSSEGEIKITSGVIPRLKTQIKIIADTAPVLDIVEGPETDKDKRLSLRYAVQDDFGLSDVVVTISPDDMIKRRIGNPAPYTQTISLNGEDFIDQTLSLDLSDHTLAGLPVDITISATDTKGQITTTRPYPSILPEMEFTHPMARRLAALRKELLWSADIDNLRLLSNTIYQMRESKDAYKNDMITYLGFTNLFYRMRIMSRIDGQSIAEIRQLMWSLALRIDGGSLKVANKNLQDALSRMAQALENPNMTDEEFSRLQQELESAMAEYMDSMISELAAKLQDQGKQVEIPEELREHLKDSMNTNEFLQDMMDALENGSREDVAEALRQMEGMLDSMSNMNIQPMSEEMQQQIEELAKLKDIIRDQETLLDETQTLAPPEELTTEDYGEDFDIGEESIFKDFENFLPPSPSETYHPPLPDSAEDEQRPKKEEPSVETGDMADTQQDIREDMRPIREKLEELTGQDPDFMRRADSAMRDSRDALVNNAPRASIPHQERALRELKQGMQQSMQNMASGMGQLLSFGLPNFGKGQRGQGRKDPLGRSMGENGRETDNSNIDLTEDEKRQRLRAIRDKILQKSDGVKQDPMTDEYFDKLLDRF